MEKGKIIVIEGTDCSGKETQSKKLIENLNKKGIRTGYFSFPNYKSPSGKIVGLPYLGKPYLAEELVNSHTDEVKRRLKEKFQDSYNENLVNQAFSILAEEMGIGWFPEGAPNVDPRCASGLYAIDRLYNLPAINEILETGENLVIDRYMYSNMAHQGGKKHDEQERQSFYEWDQKLEMEMFGLPESDIRIFLHMPTEYSAFLKKGRSEALDEHERDTEHLLNAEKAYLEIASRFDFTTVECIKNRSNSISEVDIKTPEEISKEVFDIVARKLA